MITISLPFVPLSKSNSYKTTKTGRFYKSAAVKEQEGLIIDATQSSLPANHELITVPVKVTVVITRDNKRRFDIDNCNKILWDCMNGLVWKDDVLIHELHMSKITGAAESSTTITVEIL